MTIGGAVLLAAGTGSRLGGRPKSLLRVDGELLIHRQLSALHVLNISPIMVVLGHHGEAIRPALKHTLAVNTVSHPTQTHSQADSLRLGLGALPVGLADVLVTPLDMPLLDQAAYQDLIAAWQQRGQKTTFLGPVVGGKPGNPVILAGSIIPAIVAGNGPYGSGRWRDYGAPGVEHWQSDNPAYVTDIDTEEDRVRVVSDFSLSVAWDEI